MKHHTQQNNTKFVPMMMIHEQEPLVASASMWRETMREEQVPKRFKAHNKSMTTNLLQTTKK
jgi:hypothetical protein